MKKLFNYLAALILILSLNSCGEGYDAAEVTVKTLSTVSGTLSQYVTVDEKDYTVYIDPEDWPHCSLALNIAVESDPKLESDTNEVAGLDIEAILLDTNETPISITLEAEYDSKREFQTALKNGAERLTMKFEIGSISAEEAKKIKEKAKYVEVKVSGEIKKKEVKKETSNSSSSLSSKEIDDYINQYSILTDQFVRIAKKASKGDTEAKEEYSSLEDRLTDIYSAFQLTKDEMTEAQIARLNQIHDKMVSAIIEDTETDTEDSSDAKASTSSTSSKNIDKWLDQYEKVMDKYVKVAAKAAKGDMPSITEAASLTEEVTSLASKLDDVKGDMSAAQAARLAKIAAKMASAM